MLMQVFLVYQVSVLVIVLFEFNGVLVIVLVLALCVVFFFVYLHNTLQNGNFPWPENVPSYKFVTIKDLLDGAKPQCDADESYWTKFAEKPESPAVRK